jgi:hypothetical protein
MKNMDSNGGTGIDGNGRGYGRTRDLWKMKRDSFSLYGLITAT